MKRYYWRAFRKITRRMARRVRIFLGLDLRYHLNGFSILLPPDHLLPLFQKEHPMHERFIPLIAKNLTSGDLVIDVGANCGDTIALMHEQNQKLSYVCVEPDSTFLSYLKKNILQLKQVGDSLHVVCVQALIGKAVNSAFLTGEGGTKKVVLDSFDDTPISSRTIDDIHNELDLGKVRFIKSDVDGFDYDVLDSAADVIRRYSPILYFEAQVDNLDQLNGFMTTLREQVNQGYEAWVIFDNYGNLILNTKSVDDVLQIFNYVWCQSFGISTRTIYYLDILAVCKHDLGLLDLTIQEYTAKFSS